MPNLLENPRHPAPPLPPPTGRSTSTIYLYSVLKGFFGSGKADNDSSEEEVTLEPAEGKELGFSRDDSG
jgi:hypothetical protein